MDKFTYTELPIRLLCDEAIRIALVRQSLASYPNETLLIATQCTSVQSLQQTYVKPQICNSCDLAGA
jgi:hypothetical protein